LAGNANYSTIIVAPMASNANYSIKIVAPLAANANYSTIIMTSALWQPRFEFSLRIYSELCDLAHQIRVFTE
jgi:hypothetical protein